MCSRNLPVKQAWQSGAAADAARLAAAERDAAAEQEAAAQPNEQPRRQQQRWHRRRRQHSEQPRRQQQRWQRQRRQHNEQPRRQQQRWQQRGGQHNRRAAEEAAAKATHPSIAARMARPQRFSGRVSSNGVVARTTDGHVRPLRSVWVSVGVCGCLVGDCGCLYVSDAAVGSSTRSNCCGWLREGCGGCKWIPTMRERQCMDRVPGFFGREW